MLIEPTSLEFELDSVVFLSTLINHYTSCPSGIKVSSQSKSTKKKKNRIIERKCITVICIFLVCLIKNSLKVNQRHSGQELVLALPSVRYFSVKLLFYYCSRKTNIEKSNEEESLNFKGINIIP